MNIFIAFANQDRDVRDKLLRQMNLVKDRQGWNIWTAKEIKAGERWGEEIERRLQDSEVVILLLSTDFFNSKYITETELPKVLEKHQRGECLIIPVIARPCHWKETSFGEYAQLGDIQALPIGEVALNEQPNEDRAYFEVVAGIKDSIRAFRERISAQQLALRQAAERKAAAVVTLKQEQQLKRDETARMQREEEARRQREAEPQKQKEQAEKKAAAQRERAAATAVWEQEQQRKRDETARIESEEKIRLKKEEEVRKQREALAVLFRQTSAPVEAFRGTAPSARYNPLLTNVLYLLLMGLLGLVTWRGIEKCSSEPKLSVPSTRDQLSGSSTTQNPFATTRKSGLEMVAIQGGVFQMGSPANEEFREGDECQHSVTVDDFSVGKYEVTQADWREIMGSDPLELNFKGCDDCPVETISWNNVQGFLKKLNATHSGRPMKYRLPTEVEWEYAAKGGKDGLRNGNKYAGSNDLDNVAWYSNNADSKTHAVGGKSPNELGLYDMSGNVWEWCDDVYKAYPKCKKVDEDGRLRVMRGGGWPNLAPDCRSANRINFVADYGYVALGFRLAHD